jgi:hypothetical protein
MMIDYLIEIIIYAIFPYYKRKKRKEEEWHGFVEEKKSRSDYSLSKQKYSVVFRTSEGQKRKIKVDRHELFDKYAKGRRYHKKRGEYYPDPVE